MGNVPLGSYAMPGQNTGDDTDDVDWDFVAELVVAQTADATLVLRVNWPSGLSNVQVTIQVPDEASMGTGTISPAQAGQSITTGTSHTRFTHPAAAQGDVITYTLPVTADATGSVGLTFKVEAAELSAPFVRSQSTEFVESQGA